MRYSLAATVSVIQNCNKETRICGDGGPVSRSVDERTSCCVVVVAFLLLSSSSLCVDVDVVLLLLSSSSLCVDVVVVVVELCRVCLV